MENYVPLYEEHLSGKADAETVYQNSLKDDYWKELSAKFPDHNGKQAAAAADYVLGEMKKKHAAARWDLIEADVRRKIFDGLT